MNNTQLFLKIQNKLIYIKLKYLKIINMNSYRLILIIECYLMDCLRADFYANKFNIRNDVSHKNL